MFDFAVLDAVALAEEHAGSVLDEHVAAVHDGQKGVVVAVAVGHILVEPHAVDDDVLHLLVVGQHHDVGQAQSGEVALVGGIHGLAGQLRLGVDDGRAVHGTGADADDHALVVLQQIAQADAPEEGVLGGHVAAAEDDHVAAVDQILRPVFRAGVADVHGRKLHAVVFKAGGEGIGHLVVLVVGQRIRRHHQQVGVRRHAVAQVHHEAVFFIKDAGQLHALGHVVVAGAAGQKQMHMETLLESHGLHIRTGGRASLHHFTTDARRFQQQIAQASGGSRSENSSRPALILKNALCYNPSEN